MSTDGIPQAAIRILLEIGRQDPTEAGSLESLLKAIVPFDEVNRMGWTAWDAVTQSMSTADVLALFRGLTIADTLPGWGGGSVAGAIWVFRELNRRDVALPEPAANWALANNQNPWIPFGSNRLGARDMSDYRSRRTERALRQVVRAAEVAEVEEQSARRRAVLAPQRALASQLRRSPARATFLEALATLSTPDQLRQLANDGEFPVEWYPVCLACAATNEVLSHLEPDVVAALREKLWGRHRGPWGLFKQRLAAPVARVAY